VLIIFATQTLPSGVKPDENKDERKIDLELASVAYLKCDHEDSDKHMHCAVLLGISFDTPSGKILGNSQT
jgi:hypothetical protein